MENIDGNVSVQEPGSNKEDQNTKLRLKLKKLQDKITQLNEKIKEQSEVIFKHKSK
jgi:peptidoglycan hydrolase CwlO-like protein